MMLCFYRVAWIAVLLLVAGAADWPRFRGCNGGGSTENTGLPLRWSSTESIAWKTPLPGFGSSSPIVVGDRVFVTCYSGYGLDRKNPGEMEDLRLHVVCLASADGRILWARRIRPRLPEREFSGYMVNHGYASASPASDGKAVYAFFGRSGAWAFDLEGKLLWKVSLGEKTHEFGTGGSPMLDGDLVIFNATVESGALVALRKATGEEVWRTDELRASWATPAMLTLPGGERELVFNVATRVYAFDPKDGRTLWECAYGGDVAFGSVTVDGDTVYISGGNSRKATAAVRGGGRGDVTDTHLLWEIKKASKIPTLLMHDELLYCVGDGGIARCLRPSSGEIVYEQRLSRVYPWASPIVAEDKIYVVGKGRVLVLAVGPEYEELAVNEMSDGGRFHATPAVDGNKLLIRSDAFLYCVGR
jgi:hypothetical protein